MYLETSLGDLHSQRRKQPSTSTAFVETPRSFFERYIRMRRVVFHVYYAKKHLWRIIIRGGALLTCIILMNFSPKWYLILSMSCRRVCLLVVETLDSPVQKGHFISVQCLFFMRRKEAVVLFNRRISSLLKMILQWFLLDFSSMSACVLALFCRLKCKSPCLSFRIWFARLLFTREVCSECSVWSFP